VFLADSPEDSLNELISGKDFSETSGVEGVGGEMQVGHSAWAEESETEDDQVGSVQLFLALTV
jgi:hypothetical protein